MPRLRHALQAEFAVTDPRSHKAAAAQALTLRARPGGARTADLVAAMSALLGQLADRIATSVRAAPPPGATSSATSAR
jgi:hypothetical protein